MVGFRRPRMYNPQEEKTKQAKLFEKKDFSHPIALFLELVTTLFIINPNFLKKSQFFFKKANNPFSFYQYLYHYYLSIIILLHTRWKKQTDLPTLIIYILLILLFLLHHNIDAFKKNDYYFAKTKKYQIFEQKQNPICKNFVHVKRANK